MHQSEIRRITRSVYYEMLHNQISQDTGVPIRVVKYIRCTYFARHRDRKDMAMMLARKMQVPRKKLDHPRSFIRDVFKTVASCTAEQWDIIVQLDDFQNPEDDAPPPAAGDALSGLSDVGQRLGAHGPQDLSTNHDHYLYDEPETST